MSLYDAVAAVAFVQPDLVTWQDARIDMELTGSHTRGRTVVETRAAKAEFNAQFAADIDAAKAKQSILDALKAEASW